MSNTAFIFFFLVVEEKTISLPIPLFWLNVSTVAQEIERNKPKQQLSLCFSVPFARLVKSRTEPCRKQDTRPVICRSDFFSDLRSRKCSAHEAVLTRATLLPLPVLFCSF